MFSRLVYLFTLFTTIYSLRCVNDTNKLDARSCCVSFIDGHYETTRNNLIGCFYHANQFTCCCAKNMCNTVKMYRKNLEHQFLTSIPDYVLWSEYIVHGCAAFMAIGVTIAFKFMKKWSAQAQSKGLLYYETYFQVDLRQFKVYPRLLGQEQWTCAGYLSSYPKRDPPPPPSRMPSVHFHSVVTYASTDVITNRESRRSIQSPSGNCRDILQMMLKYGPNELEFDGGTLLAALKHVSESFLEQPSMLEVDVPIHIFADTHGQYSDLWRWLNIVGWPPQSRMLFLGDMVDRGRHSLEVVVLIFVLKVVFPFHVYVCRGNHEDRGVNMNYSFHSEVMARFSNMYGMNTKVFDVFSSAFSVMPFACLIGKRILCMHGGLSPKLKSLDDILAIKRPLTEIRAQHGELACDMVWSDPDRNTEGFQINYVREKKKGIGYIFGLPQIHELCQALKVDLIVRGHQAPLAGYEKTGRQLITIFSAPGYRGIEVVKNNFVGNLGASLSVREDGSVIIYRIEASSQMFVMRDKNKLEKGESYEDVAALSNQEKNTQTRSKDNTHAPFYE